MQLVGQRPLEACRLVPEMARATTQGRGGWSYSPVLAWPCGQLLCSFPGRGVLECGLLVMQEDEATERGPWENTAATGPSNAGLEGVSAGLQFTQGPGGTFH